ncbi:hypothetical protein ES705_36507 [subsurface metagenome]
MLEVDKILQLKEEFILYKLEVGNGMYRLFNIENGDSFKLNETSYYMLSLFDENRSIGEIKRCIIEKYPDIESNSVLIDFEKLIMSMKKQNIFKERR